MNIPPHYMRLYDDVTSHRYYVRSLVSICFLVIIGYFITWPIVAYDTDLWYHLSGGRYFWQTGTIANNAFFSYVTPQKSWYNYYWLFQAIISPLLQFTGYYGLIVLRCFLYLLTVLFIFFFFYTPEQDRKHLLIGLSFFICYPISLILRELLVRPHLFSYLFIVVFLYILEQKRDKIWLLPILGIFWCNIHGIEFPIMMLIVFAYLAEMYYQDFRKRAVHPDKDKRTKRLLIATLYTVFLTPQVIELVTTPFSVTFGNALHQHLYISELRPLDFNTMFVFPLFPFFNLVESFQRVLFVAVFFFIALCLVRKRLRISHLIIFLASIALLRIKEDNRFIYEFILLTLPIIRQGIDAIPIRLETRNVFFHRAAPLLMIIILVIIPCLTYGSRLGNRPEYPMSQTSLPTGVVKFLNDLDVGGNIMNEPNTGGYLHWALKNKYKIYMDMELSLFSDYDFAYINNALYDENTFRLFVKQYDPAFISVSLSRAHFKGLISKGSEFKPIFYDDKEVLYVNAQRFPDIAASYEIKYIDPFQYKNIKYETETKERLSFILEEAMKLKKLYPDCGINNSIIANIMVVNNRHQEALPFADAIIRRYPEMAYGYSVKADALFGLERYSEAASDYAIAINKGPLSATENMYRNLALSYSRLKKYKVAYAVLSAGYFNPYNLRTSYQDIYDLGMMAAAAGKLKDAINFLKIAELKVPSGDAEYTKKIKDNLLMLDTKNKQ